MTDIAPISLKKNQGALVGGSLGGGKGWLKLVRFEMTSERTTVPFPATNVGCWH